MEKKKFKDLQVGDSFYYIIPNGEYIKYQIKKISRSIGSISLYASSTTIDLYLFNIPEWQCEFDRIDYDKAILIMDHRVHINPGETHCDTFGSKDLGTNTKLFTFLISIPEKKTDDVNIKTDISTKITGIADTTIRGFPGFNQEREILMQTNYGCGKLVNISTRLDQCKGYKAIALLPPDKRDNRTSVVVSLDKEYAINVIKAHLTKRLDSLLLSIEQEEKASVKLQAQIDSL